MQIHTRLVAVGYILLAALAVVVIDLRIVLVPAASASLVLLIGGVIIFRRLNGALSIPWPGRPDSAELDVAIVIEETPLPILGYDQELIVAVRTRHLPELLACGVLAGIALYVMLFSSLVGSSPEGLQIGGFQAEFICGAGLGILLVSLQWFSERRFLSGSYFTIGTLLGRDPGFFRAGITYQFFDNNGERRGGRGPLWGRGRDNAVLVLYDPKDADINVTHGGFLFHRFRVILMPARNRQRA